MKLTSRNTRQQGYSIIEMLVAVGITGFLTLALAGIMASSKKNYDVTDATTQIQQNARFAMKTIAYDARLAGFYGCSKQIVNIDVDPVSGVTAVDAALASGGGDQMTLSFADSSKGVLESIGSAYENETEVAFSPGGSNLSPDWKAGATMVIGDCSGADVVEVADIEIVSGSATVTFSPALSRNYLNGVSALLFYEKTYSIGYRQEGTVTTGLPVLFAAENGNAPEEIVTGIEFSRFLYGIDDYQVQDDDYLPEIFTTWDDHQAKITAGGSGKVVSIQVGLLVRSVSNAIAKNGTSDGKYSAAESKRTDFQVLDINTADDKVGTDGGLTQQLETAGVTRQVFSNTIAIRNNTDI